MTVRRLADITGRRRLTGQVAYMLSDGRVLDFDARGSDSPSPGIAPLFKPAIYNPATDSWTIGSNGPWAINRAPYPAAYGMTSDDRLIIAGTYSGVGTQTITNTVETWQYAVSSDTWTRLADLPSGRSRPLYWMDDDVLWVAGGFGPPSSVFTNTLFRFDGSWSTRATLPASVNGDTNGLGNCQPAIGVTDSLGRHYIGPRQEQIVDQFRQNWRYNPGSDSWDQLALVPATGRRVPGMVYVPLNNSVYLIFGLTTLGDATNTVYQYSIDSNTWTVKTSFPSGFYLSGEKYVFYQDGFIYALSGSVLGTQQPFVRYDVINDSWAWTGERFAVPLATAGPTVISDNGGGFYSIGGLPIGNLPVGSDTSAQDCTECEHWIPDNRAAFILSWGADNAFGKLGLGDSSPRTTPTTITAIPDRVVKIVTNGNTSLFLTDQMQIWSVGDNTGGMLGNSGVGSFNSTPALVTLSIEAGGNQPKFMDVAIGGDGALALTVDSRLFVWGTNANGSLGRGNTTSVFVPTQVTVGSTAGISRITCGDTFSAFLAYGFSLPIRALWTCGLDDWGQLAQAGSYSLTPTTTFAAAANQTETMDSLVEISAGERALLGVKRYGGAVGSGRGDDYRLSAAVWGLPAGRVNVMTDLSGMPAEIENARQAGRLSWFRTTDGGVWSWGTLVDYGVRGQTGTFDPIVAAVPASPPVIATQIPAMSSEMGGFAAMSMIGSDELLYTWGYGGFDQMGSGADLDTNPLPVSINGLTGVLGAAMAQGVMIVIATMEPLEVVSRGRSYAQIIG